MASSSHGGRRPRGESPFVLRSQCKGQLCDRATPTHTHRHSRRSSRLASTAVVEPSLSKDNGFVPNGGLNETVNGHQPPGSPRLDAFDGEGWVRTPRTGYTYAESQTYRDHCSKEVPMPHMARLPLWGSGERAARPDVHLELVETYDSVLTKGLRTVVYAIPAWCSLLDTYLLTRNPANLAKRPYLDGSEDEDELVIIRHRRIVNIINNFWRQVKKSPMTVLQSAPIQKVISKVPGGTGREDSRRFLLLLLPLLILLLLLTFPSDNLNNPLLFISKGFSELAEWLSNVMFHAGMISMDLVNGLLKLSSSAWIQISDLSGSLLNLSVNTLSSLPQQLISVFENWIAVPTTVILDGLAEAFAPVISFSWFPSTDLMNFGAIVLDIVPSILRLPVVGLANIFGIGMDWASWIAYSGCQFIMEWIDMVANVFRALLFLVLDVFTLVVSIPSYLFTGLIWGIQLPFNLGMSGLKTIIFSDFVQSAGEMVSNLPTKIVAIPATCVTIGKSALDVLLPFPLYLAQYLNELTMAVFSGAWNGLLWVISLAWSIPILLLSWIKTLVQAPLSVGELIADLMLHLFSNIKQFGVASIEASSSYLGSASESVGEKISFSANFAKSLTTRTTSAIVSVPSLVLPWASLIIEAPVIAIRFILLSLTDNFILDGVQSAIGWPWNTLKSWGSMPLTHGQGLVNLIPSVGYRAYEGFTNIPMLPSLVLPWASFIIEAPVLVIRRMLLYLADNAIFDAFSTLFERSYLATTTFAEYPVNFALWTMNSLTTTGAFLWNGMASIGSITPTLPQLTLTWASLIVETPVALIWSLLDVSINIVGSITSVPIAVADLAFQGISWIGLASENGMASFSSGFEKIFHYLSVPLGYVGTALWNLPVSTSQSIWSVTGFVWNWFWYQGQTISEAVLSGSDYWVTCSESIGQTGLSLISRILEWISWPFSKSFEQVGNFGTVVAETTSFLSAMSSEVTKTGGMALSFLFAPLLGTWNWLTHMDDIAPTEDSSETKKIDVIDVKIQRLMNLNMLETKVNDYLQKGISDWETKFQSDLEQTQSFLGIKSLDETSFDGKYPQFEMETPDFSLKIRDLNLDHTMEDENLTKDVYLHKDKLLTKLAALKELFIMSNDRIRDCCNKADFPMWISDAGKKNLESHQEALGLLNQNLATTQDLILAIKNLMAKVPNDFNILLGDELKKQAKAQVLEEIQALINLNVGQLNKINESDAARVVAAAIAKYDADKTGLFDYAAESAGASVVSIRCSETYTSRARRLSLFGIPFWTFSWGPRVAIQNGLIPGQCWAFKGSQGYLVIQLSRPLKPQKFSMEHIPRNLTPNGRLDSAPKDFQVLGLRELHDQDPIQLGNFTYVLEGAPNQFFDSSLNLEEEMRLRFVELRILSNHGNMNYTCLYRFRVHGQN